MNRVHIVLLFFLLHLLGCSRDSTPPPTSSTLPPTAETQSSAATPSSADASTSKADSETSSADEPHATAGGMSLYREAQGLMKEGKLTQGYTTAKNAMAQFVAEGVDLPWLMLESIDAGGKRVDVHLNMGERERQMPDDGIVRPLSFRIWSGDDDPTLLQVIDFEIGRSNGESVTAAIGEMTDSGHANYGPLEVDAPYEVIRQRVVELVTQE